MQVWIDNTGLHSAGRCLVREATIAEDVLGLLQFATLLVFSDRIRFGYYKGERVGEVSAQFRDRIMAEGVSRRTLPGFRLDAPVYKNACLSAAETAAGEWPHQFQAAADAAFGAPVDAPTEARRATGWMAALQDGALEGTRAPAPPPALRHKGAEAVEYMLAASPALARSVARTRSAGSAWRPAHVHQLEAYLRALLNEELARAARANYVPAVSRAAQVARDNGQIIAQLHQALRDMEARLRPGTPSVPSVASALLDRSKGDPAGIIQEALEMRRRSRWLRRYLADRLARMNSDPDGEPPGCGEEDEFARYARSVLKMEREPRLIDAIVFQFTFGLVPSIGINLKEGWEFVSHAWWKRRRLAVLTDIANRSRLPATNPAYIRTLVKQAMHPSAAGAVRL